MEFEKMMKRRVAKNSGELKASEVFNYLLAEVQSLDSHINVILRFVVKFPMPIESFNGRLTTRWHIYF